MRLGQPSPGAPLFWGTPLLHGSCSPVHGGEAGLAPAETWACTGEHHLMLLGIIQTELGGLTQGEAGGGMECGCEDALGYHQSHLTACLFFSLQALCGCTVNIPTIDGRVIPLPCNDIIKPGTVKRLRREGLPFPKAPSQRGDLIVEFKICFPDRIAPQTRQILKQHLPCA